MASKLRNQILSSQDVKGEVVTVPEWNCDVYCKELNGTERAAFVGMSPSNAYDILLTNVLDPETKEPIFEIADRDALYKKSGGVLEKLTRVIFKLSGLWTGAVEEAEKNS